MAARYWVGGSGTWNTTSTTNWSATSGGASGASVPTAADSVIFDQATSYAVTMTGALTCLDFTVSAGTVSFATGTTPTLAISGSISLAAGTTTWNSTGTITFNATTTGKTISTNNTNIDASVTFNGTGGGWTLQNNFTAGITRTVTLTAGTLDLQSYTLTCGLFSGSGSTARTIAFGTGNITVNGTGNVWNTGTVTSLTITGTPVVNVSNNTATAAAVLSGALAEASAISFNITTGTYTLTIFGTSGYTYKNIDFTGFAGTIGTPSTVTIYGNLKLSTGMSLTASASIVTFGATSGTKTITSNGKTMDFPVTFNGIGGTWQLQDAMTVGSTRVTTLTNGTLDLNSLSLNTGTFISSNSNARTIAFGTGSIVCNANSSASLDITTATNLSITGTPQFSLTNTTSNGAVLGSTAGYFTEANSLSVSIGSPSGSAGVYIGSGSVATTLTGVFKNIDLTGFTGTLANSVRTIYGNLTVSTGTTATAGTSITTFGATSGTKTITSNGKTLDFPVTFNGIGGTWQLQDAMTVGATRNTTLTNGTIDLNNQTLTTGLFVSNVATTRSIAFGTGQIYVNGNSSTCLDLSSGTGFTMTGTPQFSLTNVTSNGALVGSSAVGYFTEANSISAIVGSSTGAAGIYVNASSAATSLVGYFKDITLTGLTGSLANSQRTLYGNLTIASGMTLTAGTATTTFAATSGTKTITSNGKTIDFPLTFNGVGGTWQLQDAMTVGSTRTVTLTSGTLNLNNLGLTTGLFSSSASTARTIAFGTGNITVNGTGTVWNTATPTSLTVTGTPLVNVSNGTATATTVSTGAMTEANSISFNFTTGTYALSFLNSGSYSARNVDFTGFSGTWSATSTGFIYGNLTISSGMTLTASTSAMTFGATSGTKTITTNGKTLDFPVTFNGIGGTWQILGNTTLGSTRALTLTNGTLDLNNFKISSATFSSSGSTARTVAFGTSGQLELVGNAATIVDLSTGTNFSTTGTVYINSTYTGATGTRTINTSLTEAQISGFNVNVGGTSGIVLSSSATDTVALTGSFNQIDLTGFNGTLSNTARTIYGNVVIPASGGTLTAGTNITSLSGSTSLGTRTITTNGRTIDFPISFTGAGTWQLSGAVTVGSTRTVTLGAGTLDLQSYTLTSGAFSSSNSTTRSIAFGTGNITVIGTGTIWDTLTSTNLTTTGTQVANISNNTSTSATVQSGTLNEANAISFNFTTGTYILNFFKITGTTTTARNVDFTGFSGTLAAMTGSFSTGGKIYGNITFSSGMNISSGNGIDLVATSGNQMITTNGKTIPFAFTFNCPNTTINFGDAFNSSSGITHTSGAIDSNYPITIGGTYYITSSANTSLKMNGNTFYLPQAFIPGDTSIIGMTLFSFTALSSMFQTWSDGDLSNLTLNVGVSGGYLEINTGSITLNDITNTQHPATIYFSSYSTTTVNNFTFSGIAGSLANINLTSTSAQFPILSKSSGIVACDYLNIRKSTATGGATWYAGSHSVNSGNNSGWIFTDPPPPIVNTGNFFFIIS